MHGLRHGSTAQVQGKQSRRGQSRGTCINKQKCCIFYWCLRRVSATTAFQAQSSLHTKDNSDAPARRKDVVWLPKRPQKDEK